MSKGTGNVLSIAFLKIAFLYDGVEKALRWSPMLRRRATTLECIPTGLALWAALHALRARYRVPSAAAAAAASMLDHNASASMSHEASIVFRLRLSSRVFIVETSSHAPLHIVSHRNL